MKAWRSLSENIKQQSTFSFILYHRWVKNRIKHHPSTLIPYHRWAEIELMHKIHK
jgi:hypothetical protein